MFPKGFEWVIIMVTFLFVLLPIIAAVLVVVLLVKRSNNKKAGPPDAPGAVQAAPTGPSIPAQPVPTISGAGTAEEARARIDRLLAERNLTDRERDILVGIYQGKTQAQLAEELFLSRSTIGTYCTRAYEKLGVASKDEAIAVLRRAAEQPGQR